MDAEMKSRPDGEEQVLVFISIFIRNSKHRDLDASSSIWDIRLVRGEAEVAPEAIDPVRFSPGLAAIMPYVDRFDESYFLRFPLVDAKTGRPMMSPGGEPVRLQVRSALGEVQAEWTLVGEGSDEVAVASVPLPKKQSAHPSKTENARDDESDGASAESSDGSAPSSTSASEAGGAGTEGDVDVGSADADRADVGDSGDNRRSEKDSE